MLELQGQVQAASARSCQQQPQEAAQAVQAAVRAEQAIRAADRGKAEAYMRNQVHRFNIMLCIQIIAMMYGLACPAFVRGYC